MSEETREIIDLVSWPKAVPWQSVEHDAFTRQSNKKTIDNSLGQMRETGFISEKETAELINWITDLRKASQEIYRTIYPSEKTSILSTEEPYYHQVDMGSEWSGHTENTMASTARIFSSLIKAQQSKITPENSAELARVFGPAWTSLKFDKHDFKSLMAVAAFHEMGDWWVRKYFSQAIRKQRKQWQSGQKPESLIELCAKEEKEIPQAAESDNKQKIREENAETRLIKKEIDDGIKSVRQVINSFKGRLEENFFPEDEAFIPQVAFESDKDPAGFELYFPGGRPDDLSFTHKLELPEDYSQLTSRQKKAYVLSRILRTADFFQVLSPTYQEEVDLPTGEKQRLISKALYKEFVSFRPTMLAVLGWRKPAEAKIDQYFWDMVQEEVSPTVINLLDNQFDLDKNPYHKAWQGIEGIAQREISPSE